MSGNKELGVHTRPDQQAGSRVGERPTPDEGLLYVVCGSTGEYSDRSEWLVRAHLNEADARADVEGLETLLRTLGGAGQGYMGYDAREAIRAAMHPYDPGFDMDYTGTRWFVQAVPLAKATGHVGASSASTPEADAAPRMNQKTADGEAA